MARNPGGASGRRQGKTRRKSLTPAQPSGRARLAQWPALPQTERDVLLERLRRELAPAWRAGELSGWRVCIGINSATRALKGGSARLVLVCRDVRPTLLVEHLPLLAQARGVPCGVLSSASAALGEVFGLQTAGAVAIAGGDVIPGVPGVPGDPGRIGSLVDFLKTLLPA